MGCVLCGNDTTTDEHHVLPREFGGLKGPTVHLCPGCHQTIHRAVKNPFVLDKFTSNLKPNVRPIALALIKSVANADAFGEKQYVNINLKLEVAIHSKLKLLASDLNTSISNLLVELIKKTVG